MTANKFRPVISEEHSDSLQKDYHGRPTTSEMSNQVACVFFIIGAITACLIAVLVWYITGQI